MPIENIPSVLRYGLLSFNCAKQFEHDSIALKDVQNRRDRKKVIGGYSLHDYANLYFNHWNPMLSRLRTQNKQICILVFSIKILDIQDCVVSDRNAAADYVRFFAVKDGLKKLDFHRIHQRYWTDANPDIERANKKIKCAEVLVPHWISPDYIVGAVVVDEEAKEKMLTLGFNKEIIISPKNFF